MPSRRLDYRMASLPSTAWRDPFAKHANLPHQRIAEIFDRDRDANADWLCGKRTYGGYL